MAHAAAVPSLEALSFAQLLAACGGFFAACTLSGLGLGYVLQRRAWAIGRKVFDVPLGKRQFRTEAIGTLLFLLLWIPTIAALLGSGVLRFTDGWASGLVTFAGCWYGFQVLYYFLHRAMHHPRLFWVHRWHHESRVTTPLTGLSMHSAETLGWMFAFFVPALLLSWAGMLSLTGWMVFFGVHFVGNIAGHANAEIFPIRATRLSSALFSNPIVYHLLHHARFDGHYAFGVAWMDRLLGTEWADWPELHAKIMDGHPLGSLREKGAAYRAVSHRKAP